MQYLESVRGGEGFTMYLVLLPLLNNYRINNRKNLDFCVMQIPRNHGRRRNGEHTETIHLILKSS